MDAPYRYKINTTSFKYYWEQGIGKDLLLKLGYTPDLQNAKKFIARFFEYDEAADEVIHKLHLQKGFQKGSDSLIDYLQKVKQSEDITQIWNDFFAKFEQVPSWVDRQLLRLGSEISRRAGLSALIVLRDYCLMGGYESAAINKPLIYTGALKKGAVKRLTDTVDFWVTITKENELKWANTGIQKIFLTRFIHAYARVNILSKTDWDSSKWGVPLNHWDMLATNLGFSIVFLIGLRKVGVIPEEDEVKGLLHFWKYVGYLLGIPIDMLPDTEEEAIEALYYWTMTQREGDSDSRALAKALMDEPVEANYPPYPMMRKMMKEVHLYYNHYLLGDYSCQLLGLPKTTIGRFGMINIWKTKQNERKIINEVTRHQAIVEGGNDQENVRQIYQRFNK